MLFRSLDSSGNLGLGVTPSAWDSTLKGLQVSTTAVFSGQPSTEVMRLGSNWYYNSGFKYIYAGNATRYDQASGAHAWYNAASGTAGDAISFTQAMTLDASGNLGVGTSSPYSPNGKNLNLNDAGGTIARLTLSVSGAKSYSVSSTSDSALTFYDNTAGSERARIDSSGSWLVAKTASNSTTPGFEVRKVDASTTTMYVTTPGYYSALFNRQSDDGETIVFQRQNSSVGTISVTTTATAYNTSSDYRLKNITGPVTNSGAYIDSLKPVEGTWKANGSAFVGLLAHEAQEVSRTSVATGEKDGEQMQGMDYSNSEFIANIIAELQSLRKRLADAGIA